MSFMKQVFALVSFLAASGSSADLVAFDCFRQSDLSTSGIIPFYGCDGTKLKTRLANLSDDISGTLHASTATNAAIFIH